MFKACDFLAELTQHIPPKGIQYIRRYGLYASRIRGKWSDHPEIVRHTPEGWRVAHEEGLDQEITAEEECEVSDNVSRKAWARLLKKIGRAPPGVAYNLPGFQQKTAVLRTI